MVSLIERIANLSGERFLRPPNQRDVDKMEDANARLAAILRKMQTIELTQIDAHRSLTPKKRAQKP